MRFDTDPSGMRTTAPASLGNIGRRRLEKGSDGFDHAASLLLKLAGLGTGKRRACQFDRAAFTFLEAARASMKKTAR